MIYESATMTMSSILIQKDVHKQVKGEKHEFLPSRLRAPSFRDIQYTSTCFGKIPL